MEGPQWDLKLSSSGFNCLNSGFWGILSHIWAHHYHRIGSSRIKWVRNAPNSVFFYYPPSKGVVIFLWIICESESGSHQVWLVLRSVVAFWTNRKKISLLESQYLMMILGSTTTDMLLRWDCHPFPSYQDNLFYYFVFHGRAWNHVRLPLDLKSQVLLDQQSTIWHVPDLHERTARDEFNIEKN